MASRPPKSHSSCFLERRENHTALDWFVSLSLSLALSTHVYFGVVVGVGVDLFFEAVEARFFATPLGFCGKAANETSLFLQLQHVCVHCM